jgi:hypothetical protein
MKIGTGWASLKSYFRTKRGVFIFSFSDRDRQQKFSDLRIKFYAKWKEFIKEQAVDPDQPRGI